MMKKDFLICGITGWCLKIIFTALGCFLDNNHKLIGHTSLLMFPIYGCAVLIYPIYQKLRNIPMLIRGFLYGAGILTVEFLSGSLLRLLRCCPWSYFGAPLNIEGLIRLDYYPFWIGAGLLFEHILVRRHSKDISS